MPKTVGVLVMEHIAVGLVEGNKLAAPPSLYPEQGSSADALLAMPAENIGERIKQQIADVTRGQKIEAIGLGFPGVIRNGVIEDSPNLHQVKGFHLQTVLSAAGSRRDHRAGAGLQRCGRYGGGHCGVARQTSQTDSRVDAGQRGGFWTLSVVRRRVGGRPFGGDA